MLETPAPMPDTGTARAYLELITLRGPTSVTARLDPEGSMIIGRASTSGLVLDDVSVSRAHARITRDHQRWLLEDLGSRNGTIINGAVVTGGNRQSLFDGDEITLGPWRLLVRCESRPSLGPEARLVNDEDSFTVRVPAVPSQPSMPQRRLDLLIDAASRVTAAPDERSIAEIVLRTLLAASQFSRAAIVKSTGPLDAGTTIVQVLASLSQGAASPGPEMRFSRSLLREAERSEIVELEDSPRLREAESIIVQRIGRALCVRIVSGESASRFLYVDAPRSGAHSDPDVVGFASALGRLYALGLSGLDKRALEVKAHRAAVEMQHARAVQRRMMPAGRGSVGPLHYAFFDQPGRDVAGDIACAFALPGGAACFSLGDVTGKGIAAALFMSSAQAYLNALLAGGTDLLSAVKSLNRFVCAHSGEGEFITLWCMHSDAAGNLRVIDAGHGLAYRVPSSGPPVRLEVGGGVPLGIDPTWNYEVADLSLGSDERLVLVSDGAVEQQAQNGRQFGHQNLISAISTSTACEGDVEVVIAALRAFSGGADFTDDVTISSIRVAR